MHPFKRCPICTRINPLESELKLSSYFDHILIHSDFLALPRCNIFNNSDCPLQRGQFRLIKTWIASMISNTALQPLAATAQPIQAFDFFSASV
jgi:hypothetical protein